MKEILWRGCLFDASKFNERWGNHSNNYDSSQTNKKEEVLGRRAEPVSGGIVDDEAEVVGSGIWPLLARPTAGGGKSLRAVLGR